MKFTVIIPVYNSSKTIEDVLVSVKHQTYKNFDVCIVNDGSSDNSVEIIEKFIQLNPDIKINLISTSNNGVSKARNIGINNASSEYIAFLDSDDKWHPQKLELMESLLDDKYSFYGHSSTLENFTKENYKVKKENLKEFGFKDFIIKNRFVTPSVIIKNDKVDFFNESMHYAEDHDLWLRLVNKKRALYLDIPLVKLNRPVLSPGGASSSRWKMRKGEIKMYYNTRKYSLVGKILFPFLIIFSLLKHIKGLVK